MPFSSAAMNATLASNPEDHPDATRSLLAWAGWQLEMPGDWRPLKLTGTPKKGWMIIGDAVCAIFSIHWEQPRRRHVREGEEWVEQRLKRQGLLPDPRPPAAHRFSACTWARGVQSEEDKQTTYWYGYSAPAQLVLGVKVNGVLPGLLRAQVTDQVLTSLRTSATQAESTWAMHDLSFVVPAGFALQQRHLFTGDVALEFRKSRKETLMVRQVYPGDLALSRRSFERWLAAYPFQEHRRLRARRAVIDGWDGPDMAPMSGIRRTGRKRLAFPLGALAPRHTHALAAHDTTLNRLLIAEHITADGADPVVCETAVRQMNRSTREGD